MSWLGAALMGAVIMSPAGGIYFNFAPIEAAAGRVVPLIVFIAMLATIPTALSYASMSRSLPSAGNVFTWMTEATGPTAGVYTGWILNGFYLLAQVVVPGIAALFFNQLLEDVGISAGYWTWALGVVLLTVLVGTVNFRGIDLTLRGTVIFMIIETIVVTALMITVFAVQGGAGNLHVDDVVASMNPAAAMGGTVAIFAALIFGIQGNVGFDAVSTMVEETKFPRRWIPVATLFAVVAVGVYWMITGFGFVSALPIDQTIAIVNAGDSPIAAMADHYWGRIGQVVISLLALTSILAIYISQNTASSRALYGMGRVGAAPRWVGKIDPKTQIPRNAMIVGLIVTVIATLILGAIFGTANQFNWSATITSALALLTYFAVNLSNLLYHWRNRGNGFGWFMNGIVPVLGMVVVCYVLYSSYLGSLWDAGWAYGQSVQLGVALWLIAGVGWVGYLKARRPEVFEKSTGTAAFDAAEPDLS
jgi:amino acid transporter